MQDVITLNTNIKPKHCDDTISHIGLQNDKGDSLEHSDTSYLSVATAMSAMVFFAMMTPSLARSDNLVNNEVNNAITAVQPLTKGFKSSQPKSNKQTELNLGINIIYSDKGFTDYGSHIIAVPSISYKKNNKYIRGNQLGYKSNKHWLGQASVYAQYGGARYDAEEARGALKGLDDRDNSIMIGLGYEKITKFGGFSVQVNRDVMNNSNGTTAKLAYSAFAKKGKVILFPSVGVIWQDQKYNDYYYGITASESQKTGIASYGSKASITPYIDVIGNYTINQDVSMFLKHSISYYDDEQKSSPKVSEKTAISSIIGLSYQY